MEMLAVAITKNQLWHLLPLVVAVSLVYGATRHEYVVPILVNAFRFGLWMLGFVAVLFVVLLWVSRSL
ncbi:MAG: hypothetical protein FJ295_06240 [Planctomycetes bacterium]|nr:hypothetical protein [Planctomycetota bacterium]